MLLLNCCNGASETKQRDHLSNSSRITQIHRANFRRTLRRRSRLRRLERRVHRHVIRRRFSRIRPFPLITLPNRWPRGTCKIALRLGSQAPKAPGLTWPAPFHTTRCARSLSGHKDRSRPRATQQPTHHLQHNTTLQFHAIPPDLAIAADIDGVKRDTNPFRDEALKEISSRRVRNLQSDRFPFVLLLQQPLPLRSASLCFSPGTSARPVACSPIPTGELTGERRLAFPIVETAKGAQIVRGRRAHKINRQGEALHENLELPSNHEVGLHCHRRSLREKEELLPNARWYLLLFPLTFTECAPSSASYLSRHTGPKLEHRQNPSFLDARYQEPQEHPN